MGRVSRFFVLMSLLLGVVAGRAWGQDASAEVNGTVTDSTGAAVVGAAVTLTNVDTRIAATRKSTAAGQYVFINVAPGNYVLNVAAPSFKMASFAVFELSVNQSFTQNVKLQTGAATETVEVSASAAELLQKSSSELGTVIEEDVVQDMPLNGRNFTELLTLTPGATPVSTAQGSGVGTQDAGMSGIPGSNLVKPALHGQQNRSTLYYLDGVTNTDLRGPVYGVLPMLDATSQFKVQAHNEKVEYGGVVGGIVNMVSRTGTNTLHGSAYFSARNSIFDARNTFLDVANAHPAPYHQYQFGGTVFFPLIRDRTFLALAYEGWRFSQPTQTFAYIPTAAEIGGDFTNDIYAYNIYNPYSTGKSGSSYIRTQFMCDASGNPIAPNANGTQTGGTGCNKLPTQLLDPVLSKVAAAFLRAPNFNGAQYGRPNYNYQEDRPRTDNNNEFQVRVDHRISSRDNIWARFTNMYVLDVVPVVGTTETAPSDYHGYDWGVGYTRVVTQHMVYDAQAGILLKPYNFNTNTTPTAVQTMQSLGVADAATWGGLYYNLGNQYANLGNIGSQGMSLRKNPTWSVSTDLTFLIGKHNAKIGIQYTNVQRVQENTYQDFSFSTNATYYPSNTKGLCPLPTLTCTTQTGNIFATTLLGLPSSYTGYVPQQSMDDFSLGFYSGYAQDEWRVMPKLTMEFGIRYDYLPVPKVLNGRISAELDLWHQNYIIGAKSVPDCSQVQQNPCVPGTGFANVAENNHIMFSGFNKSFLADKASLVEPRMGFAYSLRDNMVIRGGYGLFFDALPARSQYAQNQLDAAYWPWATGFTGNANAVGATLTPFSSVEGHFAQPVTPASPWGIGGYYDDPNYKPGYSNQWNLELQQSFDRFTSLSIAYVGSSNGHNNYTGYANAAPFASPATVTRAQVDAFRQIPWMISSLHWSASTGRSNYNALETRLMRQANRDLRMILSYTWGKSLDDSSGYFGAENGYGGSSAVQNFFDPRSNRSVSSYDIPQFVSFAALYDLPFGHGKTHFNHGPLAYLLGDWQANTILQFRSGQPFNLYVGGDPANIEGSLNSISNYARPNLNPGYSKTPLTRLANQWFDPGAFSIPANQFGNYPRNVMRGATVWYDDLSMFKRIPIHERVNAELRVEAYNVFNVQNIGPPGQGSSSEVTITGNTAAANAATGVGQVSALAYNPRQIAFTLRVTF